MNAFKYFQVVIQHGSSPAPSPIFRCQKLQALWIVLLLETCSSLRVKTKKDVIKINIILNLEIQYQLKLS